MTKPTARADAGKITREAVLAAALEIHRPRRRRARCPCGTLARALDRDPMILYRHAPNKAARLDGVARHEPDRAGAIEAIADKPFGYLLLWVLVIGFLALAVWRFVQAAVKRLNLTEGHRVRALLYGIAYAIAFYSTSVATAPAALRATPGGAVRVRQDLPRLDQEHRPGSGQ